MVYLFSDTQLENILLVLQLHRKSQFCKAKIVKEFNYFMIKLKN